MTRGVTAQAGFAAASSFSQAHQAATNKLRLVSETMSINFDKLRSQALIGQVAQHEFAIGHMTVTGDLVVELCYDDDEILEYCFGSIVATRVYTLTNELEKFFHLTIDRTTSRYLFRGCMVTSWTISGEAGSESPIQLSMSLVAYHGTTSATAFPSLTAPDDPVLFPQLTQCRLGDQADALAAGDDTPSKSISLTCDNNLQIDAKDTSDVAYILQPIRNGVRTVTLELGFARYLASGPISSLFGWKTSNTRLQASLTFSNGTDSYVIQIPECKIGEGAEFNVGGPAALESNIKLECFYNNNNTPMAAVTDQLTITAV